jgi:hypothetical protein
MTIDLPLEGITAAGQRPDSHRDFAAFSGPQKEGR